MELSNPLGFIPEIIIGLKRTGEGIRWIRLIFSLSFSYWVSFSTVTGTSLTMGNSPATAIGAGMVAGSAMSLVAYLRADKTLTEGTLVAVPQKTVEDKFIEERGPVVITEPKI